MIGPLNWLRRKWRFRSCGSCGIIVGLGKVQQFDPVCYARAVILLRFWMVMGRMYPLICPILKRHC